MLHLSSSPAKIDLVCARPLTQPKEQDLVYNKVLWGTAVNHESGKLHEVARIRISPTLEERLTIRMQFGYNEKIMLLHTTWAKER